MARGRKKEVEIEEQIDIEDDTEVETKKGKKDEEPKGRVKPIVIKPLKLIEGIITVYGMSPLLVNNFDAKTQQELDDIYQAKLTAKERKQLRDDKTRDRKTAEQEFEASLYPFPGKPGCYGIPAAGLKKCAVRAATLSNIPSTVATMAFHVVGDIDGLIEIKPPVGFKGKFKPVMDKRIVRVGPFGNKKPATRHRGRFDSWMLSFTVRYRADLITAEQLANLYESAGFSVGLCEYRPEKGGNLGMFTTQKHLAR